MFGHCWRKDLDIVGEKISFKLDVLPNGHCQCTEENRTSAIELLL